MTAFAWDLFHDVPFPLNANRRSRRGPLWSTAITRQTGGAEVRTNRWAEHQMLFEIQAGTRTRADTRAMLDFFIARQGGFYGFPLRDWDDYSTAGDWIGAPAKDDQPLAILSPATGAIEPSGLGDGSTRQFYVVKLYGGAPYSLTRRLTLPDTASLLVAIDGTLVDAADYTIEREGGVITFDSPPDADAALTCGCYFDVPVRLDEPDGLMTELFDTFSGPREWPAIPLRGLTMP